MVWDSDLTDRNQKDKYMSNILLNLEISEPVIFSTDKTNDFRSTRTKRYITTIEEHLKKSPKEIDREIERMFLENTKVLVDSVEFV